MEKPPVVRLYGHADSFDIEFEKRGGVWVCQVPPDTSDGVYAVELWAINEEGVTSYWTGELFMSQGLCHLVIKEPDYFITFCAPSAFMNLSVRHDLNVVKRCPHGYDY